MAHSNLIAINGWVTCDFTSVSTVFQSYQEAVCNGTPFTVEQISLRAGIELDSLDQ